MEIKSHELVVARYNENIDWLYKLNKHWKITIYNKGTPLNMNGSMKIKHSNINIIQLPNKGHEAETYAYHMLHNYGNYADLTAFIQADPFDHAPEMIQLLDVLINKTTINPEYEKYIPMTVQYNNTFPSKKLYDSRINRFFTYEEFDAKTLAYKSFSCPNGVRWTTATWQNNYNICNVTNYSRLFFKLIGQPHLLKPDQEILKFSYAACFALSKQSLMQHPKSFYEKIYPKTFEKYISPYIFERYWLHLFDQDFKPEYILPEYIINKNGANTNKTTDS